MTPDTAKITRVGEARFRNGDATGYQLFGIRQLPKKAVVKTMGTARSRRLRLLESLRRTISDKLHEKVITSTCNNGGFSPPENTSAIYTQAKHVAPGLLDQLFNVHQRACEEQGQSMITGKDPVPDDLERKQMLSAVRAAVMRSQTRFG